LTHIQSNNEITEISPDENFAFCWTQTASHWWISSHRSSHARRVGFVSFYTGEIDQYVTGSGRQEENDRF
jgi:hypothetical protein